MSDETCIHKGDGDCEGDVWMQPTWMGGDYRPLCKRHADQLSRGLWNRFMGRQT